MGVPISNRCVSWPTCSSPGWRCWRIAACLWILLLQPFSLAFGLRLPICFPARDYKQANGLYQLFIIAENGQLSKPMNYIKRGFSPLTIPWTTQTVSFGMPELVERQHSSHNRGVLLICKKGCCNSALHRYIQLIGIGKTAAGLLHWRVEVFLAYRATQYYIGEGWLRQLMWIY